MDKKPRALILGLMTVVITMSAFAQTPANGTFSGQVKDSAGKPQMGVLVELFNSAVTRPISVFTDAKGSYTAANLAPGTYFIKATAASFLPSLRENIELKSGANVMVNLTLNTLLEAFQFVPARRAKDKNDDDWGW